MCIYCFGITADWVQAMAAVSAVIVAIIALSLTWNEYKDKKKTDNHKLFSQLNRRYERNDNIQTIVKYLREKEPIGAEPDMYQLEVFLRFFEELGLYMETNSLNPDEVNRFFGFYLHQLYCTNKGRKLLDKLGGEDKHLELLQKVLTKLNIQYT